MLNQARLYNKLFQLIWCNKKIFCWLSWEKISMTMKKSIWPQRSKTFWLSSSLRWLIKSKKARMKKNFLCLWGAKSTKGSAASNSRRLSVICSRGLKASTVSGGTSLSLLAPFSTKWTTLGILGVCRILLPIILLLLNDCACYPSL